MTGPKMDSKDESQPNGAEEDEVKSHGHGSAEENVGAEEEEEVEVEEAWE